MVTFSAFADEIAPDLATQMEVCAANGVRCIDVRGIDEVNVSKFTAASARRYAEQLAGGGFTVPCIGSPIGKIRIDESFGPHLDLLKHCCELAHIFGSEYVRVFSFYGPEGGEIADYRDKVMDQLSAMVAAAEAAGVTLLLENESGLYGSNPEAVRDIFATIKSDRLMGIFDPANFVVEGVAPYDEAWTQGLAELTHYFHMKDWKYGAKVGSPVGEGDGQVPEIIADAKNRGFDGYMTLEPHMASGGQFSGFTGPELFAKAASALKNACDKVGLEYS
ncbi:MAG: TIM barrel protein [Planctomycetota bacterium]|nr:TIM barrel protein [Planctomycetota bacterium]